MLSLKNLGFAMLIAFTAFCISAFSFDNSTAEASDFDYAYSDEVEDMDADVEEEVDDEDEDIDEEDVDEADDEEDAEEDDY